MLAGGGGVLFFTAVASVDLPLSIIPSPPSCKQRIKYTGHSPTKGHGSWNGVLVEEGEVTKGTKGTTGS